MRANNASGIPSTSEYNYGRGKVLFSKLDPTTRKPIGGWRDIGNCPSVTFSYEEESTDHKSSRQGLSLTDLTIPTGATLSGNLTLENVTMANAAYFFGGEITQEATGTTALAQIADPGTGDSNNGFTFTSGALDTTDPAGYWFPLYSEDRTSVIGQDKRMFDITPAAASDLRVWFLDGSAGSAAANKKDITAYCTFDTKRGMVFVASNWKSAEATPLVWGSNAKLVFTNNNVGTVTYRKPSRMKLWTKTSEKYAMMFLGENPLDGDRGYSYQFHVVKVSGNGEFALITADGELQSIPLNLQIERAEDVDISSPYGYSLAVPV